jgi:hypothetical protein
MLRKEYDRKGSAARRRRRKNKKKTKKKEVSGRELQGAWRQDEMFSGIPQVVKQL